MKTTNSRAATRSLDWCISSSVSLHGRRPRRLPGRLASFLSLIYASLHQPDLVASDQRTSRTSEANVSCGGRDDRKGERAAESIPRAQRNKSAEARTCVSISEHSRSGAAAARLAASITFSSVPIKRDWRTARRRSTCAAATSKSRICKAASKGNGDSQIGRLGEPRRGASGDVDDARARGAGELGTAARRLPEDNVGLAEAASATHSGIVVAA